MVETGPARQHAPLEPRSGGREDQQMQVAWIGAGGIGGPDSAALAKAGAHVTFILHGLHPKPSGTMAAATGMLST